VFETMDSFSMLTVQMPVIAETVLSDTGTHKDGVADFLDQVASRAEGYDPTRGIVHGDKQDDRHTFVFDRMESGRPIADRRVLELVRDQKFSANDFTITSKGKCRLNPELARVISRLLEAF
jgi:hypothetical protein